MSKATRQEKIYLTAKANIGDKSWAKNSSRQAKRNEHVFFCAGEWKCNLFVYEVILKAGYNIGCPNRTINPFKDSELIFEFKIFRPPTTHDWYNNKIPCFRFIGEGQNGKNKMQNGDIITDNTHMGIVSYNYDEKKYFTINAGEFKVGFND